MKKKSTDEKMDKEQAAALVQSLYAINRKQRRKRMCELKLTKKLIPPMTKIQSDTISEKIRSTEYQSAIHWATQMAKKNNKYLFDNADIRRRQELKEK